MQHARGVPAVEGLQAFADFGAAAGALRHDRQTIERARGILFLHRIGHVSEPGVKQKRFGFTKFIQHAVDEAQEHPGVDAHRAGGIEQHNQTQRLFLALSLDKADRHAAMADIGVDGTAQVEPVAASPRQIAAGQPRAHGFCQPRRHRVGFLDLLRVRHVAKIDLGEIVGTRRAFHAAFAGAVLGRIVRRRNLVGCGLACRWFRPLVLQGFQRRAVGRLRRADGHGSRFHALAEPERFEDAIEPVPVGFPRREQMF